MSDLPHSKTLYTLINERVHSTRGSLLDYTVDKMLAGIRVGALEVMAINEELTAKLLEKEYKEEVVAAYTQASDAIHQQLKHSAAEIDAQQAETMLQSLEQEISKLQQNR